MVTKPAERSGQEEVNLQCHSEKSADVERHVKAGGRPISKIPSIFDHMVRNSSTIESYYHQLIRHDGCSLLLGVLRTLRGLALGVLQHLLDLRPSQKARTQPLI